MPATWITGARGFIGSHLAHHLAGQGIAVAGVGGGSRAEQAGAADGGLAHWVGGPIGSDSLDRLAALAGPPERIFHLAGGSSIGASLADPERDFERTVGSTAALLDWLRRNAPDAALVAVSSAAIYGPDHEGPIPEDAPARPCSPYGRHKQAMEELCRSAAAELGLRIVVARLFSVYGPELRKQLLWDLCGRLAAAGQARLGGTGEELRDWTHVGDVVRFLDTLSVHASGAVPVVNGATGIGTPVREIARRVAAAFGLDEGAIAFSGESRAGDPFSLVGGPGGLAPFAATRTLDQGIADYVAWFGREGARP